MQEGFFGHEHDRGGTTRPKQLVTSINDDPLVSSSGSNSTSWYWAEQGLGSDGTGNSMNLLSSSSLSNSSSRRGDGALSVHERGATIGGGGRGRGGRSGEERFDDEYNNQHHHPEWRAGGEGMGVGVPGRPRYHHHNHHHHHLYEYEETQFSSRIALASHHNSFSYHINSNRRNSDHDNDSDIDDDYYSNYKSKNHTIAPSVQYCAPRHAYSHTYASFSPRDDNDKKKPAAAARPSNNNNKPVYVKIAPGLTARLRRVQETYQCIARDFYIPTCCVGCNVGLFCIMDANYVLCPLCRTVGRLEDGADLEYDGGVGIGFTWEYLQQFQQKHLARARRGGGSDDDDNGDAVGGRPRLNTTGSLYY